jgi:hypothetical protein
MKDEDFLNWESYGKENYLGDEMHKHFEDRFPHEGREDWTDISAEGRRIYSLMFLDGEDVERESPVGIIFSSVAAAAYECALSKVRHDHPDIDTGNY